MYSVVGVVGSSTSGASVVHRRLLPREPKLTFAELGTPFFHTVAPEACAKARAGVNVTPVPPEPEVPTAVIVTVSGLAPLASIVSVPPATRLVTLASLTFVAPLAAAADSVVAVNDWSWTPLQLAFWLHG